MSSKLSVVIITFNEGQNIKQCIESVLPVADEIVVLDSFSTDNTQQICDSYNTLFFQRKFDNYSNQKNAAAHYVNFPYILSIDADEVLSKELTKSIIEMKKNPKADGYSFNRLTSFCGKQIKHCGWYPDKKLRIWHKDKGEWRGNIHEKVIMPKNVKKQHLKGNLLHYSFHSIPQFVNQQIAFSFIKAKALKEKGKNTTLLKVVFYPPIKFLRHYFFKLGIFDGLYGFVISITAAYSSFITYLELWRLQRIKEK